VLIEDVFRLAWHNLGALIWLVAAGAFFVGTLSVLLFAVNGYLFGHMLAITDAPLFWVALYAPVELISFAVGAGASTHLGLEIVRWLRHDASVSEPLLRQSVIAIGIGAAGLAVAALLEGIAIQSVWATQ
jgi:uncharacterized membrane protein SpoIIM required for sporulation